MSFIDSLKKSGDLFGGVNPENNPGEDANGGAPAERDEALFEADVADNIGNGMAAEGYEPLRGDGSEAQSASDSFASAGAEAQAAPEEPYTDTFGMVPSTPSDEGQSYREDYQADDGLTNSHISEDTEIIGDINSKGNIKIKGKVMGDVATQGNLIVEGGIFGNVSGQNIGLYACKIKGDVQATVDVMGNAGTVVLGNINANNIVMDCKCKGVVSADSTLVIQSNSYLIGDLTARSFIVDDGAVINGSIKTLTNENLDAMFNIPDSDMDF